ncbi:regulator of Vps4 activity in the MVB pathway protein [Striga asiatica]|uniref:Regulator of Vps4 activity in the MVB pathway protein n=1 Tax=Striga asiatica TaxID=4170 RepID=A0A5A7R1T9_STRAF|nr:regulator of Vps4 activity in the MVB pathway protein [Striga asiatica]
MNPSGAKFSPNYSFAVGLGYFVLLYLKRLSPHRTRASSARFLTHHYRNPGSAGAAPIIIGWLEQFQKPPPPPNPASSEIPYAGAGAAAKVTPRSPPLRNPKISSSDRSRWLSSAICALSTAFSDSTPAKFCAAAFRPARIRRFSSLSSATCATKSSKCFCFLALLRRAESRFEIILFLFL